MLEVGGGRALPRPLGAKPFIPTVRCRPSGRLIYRLLDLALAIPLCIVLASVGVLAGLAIKLDSRGPVFFRQPRRGRGMQPFTVIKFRSMRHAASDPREGYETLEADPRITRVGAFIRRTSLDELPQLLNVLQGSMSLIGPRPLVEWESQSALRTHPERFHVQPGITGLCQVTVRNSVGLRARLDKDVEYVRCWNPFVDLWIPLRTPSAVLRREAIYPQP